MKNFKKNGGFTLVELIVVIAILAILAAVAIPAYSGYIEKAEGAGDLQLLGAINEAFAAACVDNGFTTADVKAASIPVDATGKVGNAASLSGAPTVSGIYISGLQVDGKTLTNAEKAEFNADFAAFYAGNETTAFKTIKGRSLMFNPLTGGFIDMLNYDGVVQLSYAGQDIVVSAQVAQKLSDSTFMQNGALGVEGLTGKLGMVTDFAGAILGGDVNSAALMTILTSKEYLQAFAGYLDIEVTDDMSAEDIQLAINSKYQDDNGDWTVDPSKLQSMMSNGLVLYAAQNSTIDKSTATALLGSKDVNPTTTIQGKLDTDSTAAMAEAALAYGMFTSYAYYTGDAELIAIADNKDNPVGVLHQLNNQGFKDYINSAQGQKDLEGYLSAMTIVGDSAGNSTVSGDLLDRGFENEELKGLLGSALGG